MGMTGWDVDYLLNLSEARNRHAEMYGYNGFLTPPFGPGIEPPGDWLVAAGTITQTELQRDWGGVLKRVRRGETVTITNNGRADVVILSDAEYADLVRDRAENEKRP